MLAGPDDALIRFHQDPAETLPSSLPETHPVDRGTAEKHRGRQKESEVALKARRNDDYTTRPYVETLDFKKRIKWNVMDGESAHGYFRHDFRRPAKVFIRIRIIRKGGKPRI